MLKGSEGSDLPGLQTVIAPNCFLLTEPDTLFALKFLKSLRYSPVSRPFVEYGIFFLSGTILVILVGCSGVLQHLFKTTLSSSVQDVLVLVPHTTPPAFLLLLPDWLTQSLWFLFYMLPFPLELKLYHNRKLNQVF